MLYTLSWLIGQLLVILGIIGRQGLKNLPPEGGVIIASNHRSYFDPPAVGLCLNRPGYYLAKRELFKNRFFGGLMKQLRAIPVSKRKFDHGSYKTAINHLLSGKSLVLFPEGTRNRGEEFLEPKAGVGLLALEARVPLVPVYLEYAGGLSGALSKGHVLFIKFGRPISVEWLNEVSKDKAGYQIVAQELMKRIRGLKSETV
jgi:1-acyl-sn-glycerol-3-phosphate acyltransferase